MRRQRCAGSRRGRGALNGSNSSKKVMMNQERPSIAYLAGAFPSRSETFVYREIRELRARGWKVTCVTLHPSSTEPRGSEDLKEELLVVYSKTTIAASMVEAIARPITSAQLLCACLNDALCPGEKTKLRTRLALLAQGAVSLGLARRLREREVSHLHAHFAHAPTTIAMYSARQLGISFSFTGHANDIFERRALLKRKLARAQFVNCISEWHKGFFAGESPASLEGLALVRCGVDTSEWRPGPSSANVDELRLVTVCRLVPKKGIDLLIKALPLMKRRAVLVVAGDGPEASALHALADEGGCAAQISWLGAVENDLARKTIQGSDVFVLPCRTDVRGDKDGIPVALMEAMACGLAVVSGDLPAIRELIAHDETGLLLGDSTPESLAKLLDGLDAEKARKLGEAGRSRIVEEFSLEKNVDRLEGLLKRKQRSDLGHTCS